MHRKLKLPSAPARWQADSVLALVALVWGTTFVVVKQALTEISTMYFLTVRFGLASACMLAMFLPAFLRSDWTKISRGLRGGAVTGIFLWLGYLLQTFGLKYTSAGKSGFLTGLYIVLVPVISACVYQKWPQTREVVGIAVAAAGIVLLTAPSLGHSFEVNRGDLLTIGCACAFAIHLLALSYFSQRESVEAVAFGQIVCAAGLSTISLGIEPPKATWSRNVAVAIVLTAIFATALAFALQTWGQRYTSATRTALIFALEPVFALGTAVLAGGEPWTIGEVLGGALILTGILAVELKPAAAHNIGLSVSK